MLPAAPTSHEPAAPAATSGAPDAKVDMVGCRPIFSHQPFLVAMYHSTAQRCGCWATRIGNGLPACAMALPAMVPATTNASAAEILDDIRYSFTVSSSSC